MAETNQHDSGRLTPPDVSSAVCIFLAVYPSKHSMNSSGLKLED